MDPLSDEEGMTANPFIVLDSQIAEADSNSQVNMNQRNKNIVSITDAHYIILQGLEISDMKSACPETPSHLQGRSSGSLKKLPGLLPAVSAMLGSTSKELNQDQLISKAKTVSDSKDAQNDKG